MIDNNENILDMEKEFELKVLRDENEKLKNEIVKLQILLKEADSEYTTSDVSDEESICVREINRLLLLSDEHPLNNDNIKKFDILNKNLQLIRGNLVRGKKSGLKSKSTTELKAILNKK